MLKLKTGRIGSDNSMHTLKCSLFAKVKQNHTKPKPHLRHLAPSAVADVCQWFTPWQSQFFGAAVVCCVSFVKVSKSDCEFKGGGWPVSGWKSAR